MLVSHDKHVHTVWVFTWPNLDLAQGPVKFDDIEKTAELHREFLARKIYRMDASSTLAAAQDLQRGFE